jgi:hypothetical protein
VIKSGQVGASLGQLVKDVRRVMEPNTASQLKVIFFLKWIAFSDPLYFILIKHFLIAF